MTAPAARETPGLSPPTVLPLGEEIYQTLRRALMRGEFAPGSRIIETMIADQLEVSRTPIREALSRLTVEGWLESRPNKGVIVAGITPRQVVERYALRQVLEGYAARESALRITDDVLDRLEDICTVADRSISDQQAADFARLDGKLHEGILQSAGNQTLIAVWRQYLHPAHHTMFALGTRDHRQRLVQNHREIVAALRRHDPDDAETAMIVHLDYAFHNYLPENDLNEMP